jgi:hypothetical protein
VPGYVRDPINSAGSELFRYYRQLLFVSVENRGNLVAAVVHATGHVCTHSTQANETDSGGVHIAENTTRPGGQLGDLPLPLPARRVNLSHPRGSAGASPYRVTSPWQVIGRASLLASRFLDLGYVPEAEPLEGDTVAFGISGDELGLAVDFAGLNSIPTP